jgi:hypothetical protein
MVGAIDHAAILGSPSVGSKGWCVRPPRPAALLEAIEPFAHGILAEADVPAEAQVRDTVCPSLGQNPGLRDSEPRSEFAGVKEAVGHADPSQSWPKNSPRRPSSNHGPSAPPMQRSQTSRRARRQRVQRGSVCVNFFDRSVVRTKPPE